MVWVVSDRVVRADGLLNLTLVDGASVQKVTGAPDLPDADVVAWWEELAAKVEALRLQAQADKAAHLAAGGPE